jgi:hypothetical protein
MQNWWDLMDPEVRFNVFEVSWRRQAENTAPGPIWSSGTV